MDGYVLEATISGMVPIGVVPEGLRMDVGVEGTITEGPMAGGQVTGTDYLLVRPDGIGVLDVREVVRLPAGATVSLAVTGYLHPPFPLPPLDQITPDTEWPDVDVPVHGAATMRTADPSLAALNRTVYGMTGAVNMARGQIRARAESLARVAVA
ncbi:Protein of unknown function [Geodermatophilus amargosae]|uniref:Uncharacterized protein n=1 Tax=Geodermatophilus amargosae TaxID=1296565 RepID=A0A1I7CIN5_9ACTN|nr:DUF3237 family protein [Geodermatophilus amargosae]SFT99300.1 Protein of unknown function [Geodermatophilus amargosae]